MATFAFSPRAAFAGPTTSLGAADASPSTVTEKSAPSSFITTATRPTSSTHPTTSAASDAERNLLAHGSDDRFWVAKVTSTLASGTSADTTRIDMRAAGADQWQHVTDLPGRVVCLTHSGSQLAALLQDGQWLWIAEDGTGSSTGPPLPDGGFLLTLASDGDSLWALGAPGQAPESAGANAASIATTTTSVVKATTAPMTAKTRASTLPAATQPTSRIVLYHLTADGWQPAAGPALPADLSPDWAVSLTIIDHTPWLAISRDNDALDVLHQTPAGWRLARRYPAPAGRAPFKLLSTFAPPTLWLADGAGGVDHLDQFHSDGSPARSIPLKPSSAAASDRTAAYAIHAVRALGVVNDELVEQDYDTTAFEPASKPTPISLPAPAAPSLYKVVFQLAIMMALVFAVMSTTRRQPAKTEEDAADSNDPDAKAKKLMLADLARRLAAGLIDLFPFGLPLFLLIRYMQTVGPADAATSPEAIRLEALAIYSGMVAMLIYLVHTTAAEALTGRTLGKVLLGLRVVRTDGGTPDSSSLLIRNFLRVVDIGLLGLPLMFIAFSPLRQRIGDIAAGTVVIRDRVKPEGNLIEPPKPPIDPAEPAGE